MLVVSQPERGTHPDKGSTKVAGGEYMLQSRGCGGGDRVFIGDYTEDTIRSTGGVLNTKVVVPTCVRATATPLPERFLEGVGRLRGTVPLGGPILSWTTRTNSRHPI